MGWEIPASFSENPSILPETVQDERIWEVSWCFKHQSAAWETSTSVTWEINKWHGGHGNQDSHGFYHFHLQISSPLSCQHPTQAHARVLGNALWGLLGTRCHGRHGRNGCHDDSNDHVDDQEDIHLSPSQCHEITWDTHFTTECYREIPVREFSMIFSGEAWQVRYPVTGRSHHMAATFITRFSAVQFRPKISDTWNPKNNLTYIDIS